MGHSDLPSFKYLCAALNISPRVLLPIIYMPSKYSANIFDDFTELLVSISTDLDRLVITGTFNIQMMITMTIMLNNSLLIGLLSVENIIKLRRLALL